METHRVTLILAGVSELSLELSDAICAAVGDDIELELTNDVATVEFVPEGDSLRDAVVDVIERIEEADLGVCVVRVESKEANTIAKINAELLGSR